MMWMGPPKGPRSAQGPFPFCFLFGSVPKRSTETGLQKVNIQLIKWETCFELMPLLTKSMLCAGDLEGGKDACQVKLGERLPQKAGRQGGTPGFPLSPLKRRWIKTTEACSLTDTRSPKSGHWRGSATSRGSRGGSFFAFSSFWLLQASLGFP